MDTHANFVYGTITVVPSPATTGTTLSISNADAANFPDPGAAGNTPYNATVWPTGVNPNSSNAEIVRITAKGAADSGGSGNTQLTITRIQESTSARTILVGDQISATITAKTLQDIENRFTKRVSSITSSATPTPDADTDDVFEVTALAVNATLAAPTGTPTDGQSLIIRIKDAGTSKTLAYNAIYRAVGVVLPTSTTVGKTLYLGMIYNSAGTKWDVIALAQE